MKVAAEFQGPPATLTRISNELPALQIVQIRLLREDPWPPPCDVDMGGLQLDGLYDRWSCLTCLYVGLTIAFGVVSVSPSMHTYGQINKVVSRWPLIAHMQRKFSPSSTTSLSFLLLAEKKKVVASLCFILQAPISATVVLYCICCSMVSVLQ